jgi:hypothetical protein
LQIGQVAKTSHPRKTIANLTSCKTSHPRKTIANLTPHPKKTIERERERERESCLVDAFVVSLLAHIVEERSVLYLMEDSCLHYIIM